MSANDDGFNSFGKICCDITRDKGPIVSLLWNFVEGLHWTTLGRGDNGWCGAEIHNWCRWVGAARGVAVGYSSSRLQLERWSIPCRGGWRLDRPDHRVDLRLYYSMRNQSLLAFLALAFSESQGKYGVYRGLLKDHVLVRVCFRSKQSCLTFSSLHSRQRTSYVSQLLFVVN